MLTLRGSPALSPFRVQKLVQDLNGAGVPVSEIGTHFLHVIELDGANPLTSNESAVLEKLLASATFSRTGFAVDRLPETLKVYVPTPSLAEARLVLQRMSHSTDQACVVSVRGKFVAGDSTASVPR